VPGAHRVERECRGEIDAEEAVELRAIVLARRADECLEHEERRHHEEEPGAGSLRRRKGDVAGAAEGERCLERKRACRAPRPGG
jgi:hypothetical protein